MKQCTKCGRRKKQDRFHKDGRAKDGFRFWCKSCCKEHNRQRYVVHKDRLWEKTKQWRKNNPDKVSLIQKRFLERHGINQAHIDAQQIAYRAVKKGILKKPNSCSVCHRAKPLHKHHDDYNKPLVVKWVCCKCHSKITFGGNDDRPKATGRRSKAHPVRSRGVKS